MSDESGKLMVKEEMLDILVQYPMADVTPKEEALTDIDSETGSDMVGTPGTDEPIKEELVADVESDGAKTFGLEDTESRSHSKQVTTKEDDVIGRPESPGPSGESPRRREQFKLADDICAEDNEETADDFSDSVQNESDSSNMSTSQEDSTDSQAKSIDPSADSTKTAKKQASNQSGDKPLSCDFCDYRSNNSGHLKNHIRIHTS